MKKNLWIAALVAALALVFTACPPPGGGGGGGNDEEVSTNTTLASVQLAGGEAALANNANRGDSVADLAGKEAEVSLSNSLKTNAEVTLNWNPSTFKGTAKVAKNAEAFVAYNPSDKPKITFENGDKLYVEMTAEDKTTVKFYGFVVDIGSNANLRAITFQDTIAVGSALLSFNTFGEGSATLAGLASLTEATMGKVQFDVKQPSNGFFVGFEPSDPDATVEFNYDGGTTWKDGWKDGEVAGEQKIFGEDPDVDDFLYIHVKSFNGKDNYYKVKILLMRSVDIPYGTPAKWKVDTEAFTDVDAAFDGAKASKWLPINRVNTTEGDAQGILDKPVKDRTFGRAKLMWDEDGLWIYAQVWEQEVSLASTTLASHKQSSIELFINEAYSKMVAEGSITGTVASSVNQNGGQYRLSANGVRSAAQNNQTDAFNALGNSSAKVFRSGDFPATAYQPTSVTNGYIVVYQAPWLFIDSQHYPLVDNKLVSIEIQINAIVDNADRNGVLNWNSENSTSYSSLVNFGEAKLLPKGSPLNPLRPVISALTPALAQKVEIDAEDDDMPEFEVKAAAPDTGTTLAYQWYVSSTNAYEGTAVSGATGVKFTPTTGTNAGEIDTSGAARYFIYVAVTNTKGELSSSVVNSERRRLTVFDPNAPVLDHVVTGPWSNTAAWNTNYNNGIVIDVRKDDEPVSRDEYGTFTIDVGFYSDAACTTPIDMAAGMLQMKWFTTVVTNANGSGNYGDMYNFGVTPADYTEAPLRGTTQDISAIGIQTSGAGASFNGYIKVNSITFYPND